MSISAAACCSLPSSKLEKRVGYVCTIPYQAGLSGLRNAKRAKMIADATGIEEMTIATTVQTRQLLFEMAFSKVSMGSIFSV